MQHFIVFQRLNQLQQVQSEKGKVGTIPANYINKILLPSLSYLVSFITFRDGDLPKHLSSLNIFSLPKHRKRCLGKIRKILGNFQTEPKTMPDGFHLSYLFAPLIYYKRESLECQDTHRGEFQCSTYIYLRTHQLLGVVQVNSHILAAL